MGELTPEQYEATQLALNFLENYFLESQAGMGFGPGTVEALEELLQANNENGTSSARNALTLALGMTDIAISLIRTRHRETDRQPGDTIADLKHSFTPPGQ